MYEFCMVPHGSPFRDAASDDWIALGKSSEMRLIHDVEAAIYINCLGMASRALQYIKIGVDHGMARYAHSRAMYEEYDDMVLRMVPLQNAVVGVDAVHCPSSRTRKLECRFQCGDLVYRDTYSVSANFRALSLQEILLSALRSRGQASCNTKIVLVQVGSERVIKPDDFLWQTEEIDFLSDGSWNPSRSLQGTRKRDRTDRTAV